MRKAATAILATIKGKGKEGVVAADLKGYDFGQSLSAFIDKYAGTKLKTEGKKAGTRYFAP